MRGGWLGFSATNQVSAASVPRWARSGSLVQQQLPLATFHLFAHAKKGADHTINKLYLSQEWQGQSDLIIIHAVHANSAMLPPKP